MKVRVTFYTNQGTVYSYLNNYRPEDLVDWTPKLGDWTDPEDQGGAIGYYESLMQSDNCPGALYEEKITRITAELVED